MSIQSATTGTDSTRPALTRRDFLRTSALAAGAATGALTVGDVAYAGGDDLLKAGMIGCGGRCTGAASQFLAAHPNNRLIAMADIFPERLAASLKTLQRGRKEQVQVDADHQFIGFDGYRKVIDSGVDVVLIACASKFHPIYTRAALEAGKHTFCEKPHGIDALGIATLRQATALARQQKRCFVSGLMSRYSPMLRELTQRIQDGAIGEILAARANFLRAAYVVRTRQPDDSETRYQFRNWYHFKWLSGDDVTQSLVHNLDRLAMFLNEKQPVRARGFGGRSASFGYQYGDQFDHHAVIYDYTDGAQAYAYCTQQAGCTNGVQEFLFGTKGRMERYRLVGLDGKVIWQYAGRRVNWHAQEQIEMSEAIRAGRLINNGDYAAESTLTCIMGQVACYTGQTVSRDALEKSSFSFGPAPEKCSFKIDPPVTLADDGQYPVPVPGKTKFW